MVWKSWLTQKNFLAFCALELTKESIDGWSRGFDTSCYPQNSVCLLLFRIHYASLHLQPNLNLLLLPQSALVFCGTRTGCVSMCSMLTEAHHQIISSGDCDETDAIQVTAHEELQHQRTLLIGHLTSESKGLVNPSLLAGISIGVGFHSADLHPIERSALEDAFKRGIISILCCTTTLAAGVNLPANRVIIRSPWCGKRFLSCAQYLQMTGRAGRTNVEGTASRADSFILVQPNDSGKFKNMVEQHVEEIRSQLLDVSSFYVRTVAPQGSSEYEFTSVTRVLLNSMSVPVKISELFDVYRLTLLYQIGEKRTEEGQTSIVFTFKPFLKELQELLRQGHVHVLKPALSEDHSFLFTLENRLSFEKSSSYESKSLKSAATLPEDLKALTQAEVDEFRGDLCKSWKDPEDSILVRDYFLSLSPIARASSSASMSISDAENFVSEAATLEAGVSLQNPFPLLYLSITEEMSKPLIEDAQYREIENTKNARSIGKMLANIFELHPDLEMLTKIGFDKERLMEWVVGNPSVRNDKKFNGKLTRAWTALYMKELLAHPDSTDELCAAYGFDRSTTLALTSALGSRLHNLKQLCTKLERFWWYPPLASHMVNRVGVPCSADIRPLLVIRHVTIERAKSLLKVGLRTVQDVAQVFPPTLLSDNLPHTSRWMAVEIILDARMLVSEEASLLEAESCDRRRLLN